MTGSTRVDILVALGLLSFSVLVLAAIEILYP